MTAVDALLQFAGFFLQTFPVVMLMDASFDEEYLRFSRRRTILNLLIPDLLCSAAFAVWEYFAIGIEDLQIFANVFMGAVIVIVYTLFWRLIKAPGHRKLIVLIMLTHYAAILFTVNTTIVELMGIESAAVYSKHEFVSNLILTAVTFPVVHFFMYKVMRPAMSLSDNKVLKRGITYTGFAFVLYCAAILFFDFSFTRSELKNPAIVIFFSALIITDGILYFMFFSETRLVARNNKLENRIRSFDEQYRRISRDIDESRRLRHDMRHHLNAISAINKNQENKELTKYLEAYSAVYAEPDDIARCGFPALDNILRYYIGSAREKGITVEARLHPLNADMDFDMTDITVLIGNLMENAIEACERISTENKFIRISIKRSEAELLIKEENACPADAEPITDFTDSKSFVSTKHTKHIGQGLRSITIVAEKYGGSAEFKRENGVFTARAVLNIP